MLADHRGELEPVEIRHAHIDQHDSDVVLEQLLESLIGRTRLDQVLAKLAEDHLVAEQLPRLVIDQQNIDLFLSAHAGSPFYRFLQRCSHMRSAERSCSVLTGLAR